MDKITATARIWHLKKIDNETALLTEGNET